MDFDAAVIWGFIVTAAVAVMGSLTIVVAAALLGGCAIDVVAGIELPDECLFLVPICAVGGAYACVDDRGISDGNCRAACAAGRTMACEPDGVFCYQTLGDEEIWVPTVCISRNP